MTKSLHCLAQRLTKEALHHRKWLQHTKVTSFGKELPHDVSNILSPLLSERTFEEPMLHWLHRLQATVMTTFVNLCHDFPTPIIHHHCLMDNWPKKGNLILCLSFVPNDIPPRKNGGGDFTLPLMRNQLLKDLLLSNQFARTRVSQVINFCSRCSQD